MPPRIYFQYRSTPLHCGHAESASCEARQTGGRPLSDAFSDVWIDNRAFAVVESYRDGCLKPLVAEQAARFHHLDVERRHRGSAFRDPGGFGFDRHSPLCVNAAYYPTTAKTSAIQALLDFFVRHVHAGLRVWKHAGGARDDDQRLKRCGINDLLACGPDPQPCHAPHYLSSVSSRPLNRLDQDGRRIV